MAEIHYLDFDLLIERSGAWFRARILSSPAGQATADFRLPFGELELENFLLRVGRPRRGVRRLESPEVEAAKEFGGRLFEALFNGEVLGCLRSSLYEVSRPGVGLRIWLHLDAPELADLPWEYLYNPTLNQFLVLSVKTPVIRYLGLPRRVLPLVVKPPLRILVMISNPRNHPDLNVEHEWANLRKAMGDLEQRGMVALERLEEATLVALQHRLRRGEYHIFHFIGHGAYDETAQDGLLLLEDKYGHGCLVSGQYLGTLLHDEDTLRLAILNACESARTSRSDPFAGVAQSLIQQGIPAVVAMQFEITNEAAVAFAHELYAAVAEGHSIESALAEARMIIFLQGNDVEWGTPVLYMATRDGKIFDLEESEGGPDGREELYRKGVEALTAQEWSTAIKHFGALLGLEGRYRDAGVKLEEARRQLELTGLYAQAVEAKKAKNWTKAISICERIRAVDRHYKDKEVTNLLEQARRISSLYEQVMRAQDIQDWDIVITLCEKIQAIDPGYKNVVAILRKAKSFKKLQEVIGFMHSQLKTIQTVILKVTKPIILAIVTAFIILATLGLVASLALRPLAGVLDSRLAFVSDRVGNPEIYVMDEKGQVIQLTHHAASDDGPSWSPDKRRIAFASKRDGDWEIYWMNADGTGLTRVTHNPARDIEPAWSPDGTYIAFTSDRDGEREIYIAGPSGVTRVTHTSGGAESWEPAWGPNGTVLFTSDRDGKREVYRTTETGEVVRMTYTPGSGESWSPAWAWGGNYTAFVSNRDGPQEVYTLSEAGVLRRVSHTPGGQGSWGPACSTSGQFIAFTSDRAGESEIYTIAEEGVRQLTQTPGDRRSWSPAW